MREHRKDYAFAVKGNQPTLHAVAQSLLWAAPCELRTEERVNGKTIVRELARVAFEPEDERMEFADARQLWRVRQTTFVEGKAPVVDDRYIVTSLGWLELDAKQILALVRLHWGIENGHNWTMDVILGEDDSQPCQQGKDAIERSSPGCECLPTTSSPHGAPERSGRTVGRCLGGASSKGCATSSAASDARRHCRHPSDGSPAVPAFPPYSFEASSTGLSRQDENPHAQWSGPAPRSGRPSALAGPRIKPVLQRWKPNDEPN